MLISKIIFKLKNIILIHFRVKNTLKNNRYYILKYPLRYKKSLIGLHISFRETLLSSVWVLFHNKKDK